MPASLAPAAQPGPACTASPTQPIPPWSQQPGEPDDAFALFERYRTLGPQRTYATLLTSLPTPATRYTLRTLGARWHWHARAVAWDDAQPPTPWETPDRRLWDPQPSEPAPLYELFRQYLALGPTRTPAALAYHHRTQGISRLTHNYIARISRLWRWRDRAAAHDTALAAAQAAAGLSPQPPAPWTQQPLERDDWFHRFQHFLALGPDRTIYRTFIDLVSRDPATPVLATFYDAAQRYHWPDRAAAWDQHQLLPSLPPQPTPPDLTASDPASSDPTPSPADPHPWDRQPGESVRYFGIFCHYLELGPARTIAQAARDAVAHDADGSIPFEGYLYHMARRWHWKERAAAWDAHQRDLLATRTLDLRTALHEQRLSTAQVYFDQAVDGLNSASLGHLDRDQARKLLPTLFAIYKETGAIQRTEFDYAAKYLTPTQAPTSADSLDAAAHITPANTPAPLPPFLQPPVSFAGGRLWVCTGPDPDLQRDLAALYNVPGLDVQPITAVTRTRFDDTLRREQQNGHPVQLLHLAVHAGPDGIQFADGNVDGLWLSQRLAGLQIVVLCGCTTNTVGDWLRAVPFVVTLAEEVTHENAAVLAEHFWKWIGQGKHPTDALDRARAKCLPAIRPLITQHW